MAHLIDRRLNAKNKSAVNRQRFLQRHRGQIRKALEKNLRDRSIEDTESGERIRIPARNTKEPTLHHGQGGRFTHVLAGNREFVVGDRFPRPEGGGGAGQGEGSPDGEGMDDFVFEISQQEFLDLLFEDMALPNLTKRQLAGQEAFESRRAGYAVTGTPSNIDIRRSMRSASSRRIALTAGLRRQIRELTAELEALGDAQDEVSDRARAEIEERIAKLRRRVDAIPFIDEFDIRYRRHEKVPIPRSRAVMFCLMDVSGSMDQDTKALAKRFFALLYLFLSRNYDKVEVVFVRHHTSAKEVDEQEFFYSRETGGTVVSSALDLTRKIIEARYPLSEWNIYVAQASDGDNWLEDNARCAELLGKLLPVLQYYSYVEISQQGERPLWQTYQRVQDANPEVFAMRQIQGPADIYPVFRELFRKRTA